MRDVIIGIFIVAARFAAIWPQPHRTLAREALRSLPLECFEPERVKEIERIRRDIAALTRLDKLLVPEEELN